MVLESLLKFCQVTIQPFRSEIDQIIAHYLSPGAPRELNISHKARNECVGFQYHRYQII